MIANIPATGAQPVAARLCHAARQSIRAMITAQSVAATVIFARETAPGRDQPNGRRRSATTTSADPVPPGTSSPGDAAAARPGSSPAEVLALAFTYSCVVTEWFRILEVSRRESAP